jgi:hypothetical protein
LIDYTFYDVADLYDYIDMHAYWQHPVFPGKPWDPTNYYVQNKSMVSAYRHTFVKLALGRIAGKPFTVSEYTHPFPLEYSSEAVTIAAVNMAMQDYDGIFYFNFLSSLAMDKASYFDFRNPFPRQARRIHRRRVAR